MSTCEVAPLMLRRCVGRETSELPWLKEWFADKDPSFNSCIVSKWRCKPRTLLGMLSFWSCFAPPPPPTSASPQASAATERCKYAASSAYCCCCCEASIWDSRPTRKDSCDFWWTKVSRCCCCCCLARLSLMNCWVICDANNFESAPFHVYFSRAHASFCEPVSRTKLKAFTCTISVNASFVRKLCALLKP